MIKLEKDQYHIARHAITNVPINHYFALAVIDHKTDGQVYTDSLSRPGAFYIRHPYGMSLLFGETNHSGFVKSMTDYLIDDDENRKADEYLQVYPDQWIKELSILRNADTRDNPRMELHERVNFSFEPTLFKRNASTVSPLTDGESIVRTSNELFSQGVGSVVPEFFWEDVDEFTRSGVGFTVIKAGKPVSTAFSAFIFPPYLEFGIETVEGYRGNGYGYAACSALMEYCTNNGYEPVWACRAGNIASMKLAEKLGFVESLRLPYFRFKPATD